MITTIILIIALAIIVRFIIEPIQNTISRHYADWGEFFEITTVTLLITAIVLEFVCWVGTVGFPVETHRDNCATDIFSLRNESDVHGDFILGSGTINNCEYYYMFTRDSRGGFDRFKASSENCTLFENSSVTPQLQWQVIHYRPSKWVCGWPFDKMDKTEITKYDVYVPTNTIIQKFEIK